MRRGKRFAGRPLRMRESFEERDTGWDASLADDVTVAPARLPPPLLLAHFWPH
jgi:hypothetical protein